MNTGMIRCIAILRAMGSDPIVPSIGLDPPREDEASPDSPPEKAAKVSCGALAILLAVVWVAIFCASVWARG